MSDQFHDMTAAMLADAYRSGLRLFEGIEIVGERDHPYLENLDLSGSEFSRCWFHSATFFNVNLSNAKFTHCNLKCTTFERCELSGVKWHSSVVCSMAVMRSTVAAIEVKDLEAYGAPLQGTAEFLEYVLQDGAGN